MTDEYCLSVRSNDNRLYAGDGTVSVSIVDFVQASGMVARAALLATLGLVPTFGRRALGRNAMDLGSASKSGRVERARGDER